MPVYLQVRQVRDAIYREALKDNPAPAKLPLSNKSVGAAFHDAVAGLFAAGSAGHCSTALMLAERSSASWESTLRQMLYQNGIGPYLTRHQAGLQSSTSEVLDLWQAVGSFSKWLSTILWRAHQELGWPATKSLQITAEDQLSLLLTDPGWSDSVQLSGIADLVLRVPRSESQDDWCVVEFKLGRTSPEADLSQACLYHQMLVQPPRTSSGGTLALVTFTPELHERLFDTSKLSDASEKLKKLIGSLAGVSTAPGAAACKAQPTVELLPELLEMERLLMKTFQEFGAPAERAGEPIAGPTFFRFFFAPAQGIKAKRITDLAAEIQLRLKLAAPPISGLSAGRITIDVERPDRQIIPFSAIRDQLPQSNGLHGSSILPVGVNLASRLVVADLAESKHVHMLVVGTTGSGKSEWLRTAIAGLISGNTPQTLQLVLIDPKRTAFTELAGSPFLLDGEIVYPDEQPVSETLEYLIEEMEDRYRKMHTAGVDDLRGLIARGLALPRIVCICDEYADLLSGSKKVRLELERLITRLGSKARAAGIHLIIATQEARRETIRGSLDANLPARVGLRTNKDIESRLLLQENGAERLLGQGDLLFKDIGSAIRLQAPLLSRSDREEIFRAKK